MKKPIISNRKALWTLFFALSSALPMVAQEKTWSLEACIDYALKNNIQIKKTQAAVETAKINTLESKAALMPSLSGSLSQSVNYRPFQTASTNVVNGGVSSSSSSRVTQSGSYGVNASWTVWNGGRNRMNIQNNELAENIAAYAIATQSNSVQEQIVKLYVQILYMKEALAVNKKLLEQDSIVYARGEEMLKQGQMSRADLAQLASQWTSGKYDLVNTSTQISNATMQLKQLLELPPTEEMDVTDVSISDATVLQSIPGKLDVYNAALAARPEIKSSEMSVQQSELQYKIAKAGKMPTIALTGGLSDSHLTGLPTSYFTQMKNNLNATIGVAVSIPIFDNRATKSNKERAQVNILNAQLDLQQAQKDLYNSVETYWLNATNYRASYFAAKGNVTSMQESYTLANEQFKVGLKNIAELLTARANLLTAEQTALQDKYTAVLNATLLHFYKDGSIAL